MAQSARFSSWSNRHLSGVSENTIRDYFELYQQGGVEKLKELNYYQPSSQLDAHISSLEAYFRDNPPATIQEAQSKIEAITGIRRSETQVAEFLKKNSVSVVGKWGRYRLKQTQSSRKPI